MSVVPRINAALLRSRAAHLGKAAASTVRDGVRRSVTTAPQPACRAAGPPGSLRRVEAAGVAIRGRGNADFICTWYIAAGRRLAHPVRGASTNSEMTLSRIDGDENILLYPEKTPEIKVGEGDALAYECDLLALGVFEEAFSTDKGDEGATGRFNSAELQHLDEELGGVLGELAAAADFKASAGSSSFTRVARLPFKAVGIVGLGKAAKAAPTADWGVSPFQALGAEVAAAAKAHKAKVAAIHFVDADQLPKDPEAAGAVAGRIAAGVLLGGYEATRFKNKPKVSPLQSVTVLSLAGGPAAEVAITRAAALARGTLLARYLVEAPPNICTPQHLADAAAGIAATSPDVMKLEVLEREQCIAMNMGAYLGVAECSAHAPKFIHLRYTPPGEVRKRVALVGKGLTFDSGGYNLKVHGMIEMMKFDMGGAAAVLGAAEAIAALQPPGVQIDFISAACENMIDGKGMRPGDVLQAANGKTIEVNNTDAEGRLTLADALWFAQERCGAAAIVDIATLTGACMVALGNQVAGVFTPSDAMAASLTDASRAAGEKLWRMPMEEAYFADMKASAIADMKNSGGRFGGAIAASLFLREFVDVAKVEWAHIDIAGPAWDEKAGGATGYGAATLALWAIQQGGP